MGTIGTSLTTPVTFTGISNYSSDFQSILQRAVSIADLPIQALQADQTTDTSKTQALGTLNPDVASLGSAVAALGSLAATGGGLDASSSNTNVVTAANVGATAAATYTVSNIQSLASSAWATSGNFANSTTATVSSSGDVKLTVGANIYNLDVSGTKNNLTGLENAINSAGAGVTASILTTTGGSYISISANAPGQAAIQLQAVPAATDQITNTGAGSETSVAHYAKSTTTPVSVSGNMSLVVGSTTYQLSLTGANNLTGLVNAINSAGAGVTAGISTDSNGSYLTLSTNDSSAQTLQLNDTSANLITSSAGGSNAQFTLNGNIPITQSNNTINNVIPGLSFTLQNTLSSGSVTLSLTPDVSQISTALQTFVNDYNTLATDTSKQVGSSAGPLGGDSSISDIMNDMQQLVTYWNPTSGSTIHSLSDLGITFEDTSGQLTFNPTVFAGLSNTQVSDAMKFLGSSTSGFAQLASNFTQLSDPISGSITMEENSLTSDNTQLADHINTLTDQANQTQAALTTQLQAADALCAQLESQQNTLNASVESLDYVAYGMNYNSNGTT